MKKQILIDDLEQLETKEYTKFTPILVPETFEELKELCKKTGHYAVNILKGGLLNKEYIFIFGLSFRDNGDIEDIENNNVAENRTPQQMWNIIKSLIGE